jgi:hypothetical protein
VTSAGTLNDNRQAVIDVMPRLLIVMEFRVYCVVVPTGVSVLAYVKKQTEWSCMKVLMSWFALTVSARKEHTPCHSRQGVLQV